MTAGGTGYTYDAKTFRDNFEREFTWLNGFLRNVDRFGGQPALYDEASGRSWTYETLNADANRLAHALIGYGLGKNDILMHMLFNSPEFALCYIASQKAGAINCPINFRMAPGEIALQLEDSQPKIFVFGAEFVNVAKRALELSSFKPDKVLIVGKVENPSPEWRDFSLSMNDMPRDNPGLAFPQDIYAETTRLYTSGTTNRAKAVPLNSLNEVLSAHDVMMHFPLTQRDRTMNMTPWFHRGGLHSGGLTPTLYAGGEVVILREFNPRRCLDLAQKKKVTFLIGVPSIIALLARAQEYAPVDLSSLRGIVTMGSPFDKEACERYRKLFTPNIFNGYGTTETFWNTFLRPWDLPQMAGSAGQSCTDDEVVVARIPADGEMADPNYPVSKNDMEVGEILIKSPAKSAGCYVGNPEMTERKFRNGYHHTGDLGTWNEKGYITIVCRKDDMIISSGENIYPPQIEAVINAHPKVAECAVVGQPDKRHGEIVAAYVVPLDNSLTVEELKTYCADNDMLPPFKCPKAWHLVKELPHTATGKLLHYKIRNNMRELVSEK